VHPLGEYRDDIVAQGRIDDGFLAPARERNICATSRLASSDHQSRAYPIRHHAAFVRMVHEWGRFGEIPEM
jgi:hypothetical protein